jgi:hypothetical protein
VVDDFIRADSFSRNDTSFDLVESTTALACASGNVNLVVQLKREIGKLWEDISRSPYKEIFNPNVSGMYIWRCVQIQRKIDELLDSISNNPELSGRDSRIAVYGNRLIASMVFDSFGSSHFSNPNYDFSLLLQNADIRNKTDQYFQKLKEAVEEHYSTSIIPTLFKNLNKCRHLRELCDT